MSTSIAPEPTSDRIEKEVVLAASPERVWRAITDAREFGQWFGVELSGPLAPGAAVTGRFANKKYEHVTLRLWVETAEAPRRFAFRWHPFALDPSVDYSQEPTTLVTFTLEPAEEGTRLRVVESGFDAIPESRRAIAFQMNGRGWAGQVENVRRYLETAA